MFNSSENKDIKNISVTNGWEPLIAILTVTLSYLFLYDTNLSSVELVLVMTGLLTVVYSFLEWYKLDFFRNISRLHFASLFHKHSITQTLNSFLGLVFAISLVLFFFWLFPDYNQSKDFLVVTEAVPIFLLFFLPCAFFWILMSDSLVKSTYTDSLEVFGRLVRFDFSKVDKDRLKDSLLEWIHRVFFLTLNFIAAVVSIDVYRAGSPFILGTDFLTSFLSILSIINLLIIFTILPGYLFSSKLINTQLRSIDRSLLAWVVTLACYPPFFNTLFISYFNYYGDVGSLSGQPAWYYFTNQEIFFGVPVFLYIVAAIILISELIHLWGESSMGIRSSNLCNRGIVTSGPYSFTKHPVYVFKCIGWFFMFLPFLMATDILESVRMLMMFFIVVCLYALRAYTEEKHLSTDPDYVKYATWMEEHSVFSFVSKFLPFFSYKQRLQYWKEGNSFRNIFLQKQIYSAMVIFVLGLGAFSLYSHISPKYKLSYYYSQINNQENILTGETIEADMLEKLKICEINKDFKCIQKIFEEYNDKESLDKSFSKLNLLLKEYPEFRPYCHQIAHGIGHSEIVKNSGNIGLALTKFSSNQMIKNVNTCGNGYHHGLLEKVLGEENDKGKLIDFFANVCEDVYGKEGAFNECIHGVGHAAFIQLEYNFEEAKDVCVKITKNEFDLFDCLNGVNMERQISLPFSVSAVMRDGRLSFDTCELEKNKLEKNSCYFENIFELLPQENAHDLRKKNKNLIFQHIMSQCVYIEDQGSRESCVKNTSIRSIIDEQHDDINICFTSGMSNMESVYCVANFAHRISMSLAGKKDKLYYSTALDICKNLGVLDQPKCNNLILKDPKSLYFVGF